MAQDGVGNSVATVPTAQGNIVIQTSGGDVNASAAATPSYVPTDDSFPVGFFTYDVENLTPGQVITLNFTVPSDIDVSALLECHDQTMSCTAVGHQGSGNQFNQTFTAPAYGMVGDTLGPKGILTPGSSSSGGYGGLPLSGGSSSSGSSSSSGGGSNSSSGGSTSGGGSSSGSFSSGASSSSSGGGSSSSSSGSSSVSLTNPSQQTVTLSTSVGTISAASFTSTPAGGPNSGVTYPVGWLTYTINGLPVGGTATVTLTLPAGSNPTGYVKDENGTFTTLSGSAVSISGNTVTLQLTDGSALDGDGVANGVIVDPGAPIAATVATPTFILPPRGT